MWKQNFEFKSWS